MNKRQRRHQKISHWLSETFLDKVSNLPMVALVDAGFWLEERLQAATCWLFGHYVIDDQCGIPEHRFCSFCMKSTPLSPVDG